MHTVIPFSLFLNAVTGFALAALHARKTSIRLNGRGFDALLASLQPIDLDGVSCVAKDFLEPHRGQISMEPEVIWQLMGGDLGLRRMRVNADLLLAIAAHASQWNDEEGVIVTERMRRDALRLRSALRQIRLARWCTSWPRPSSCWRGCPPRVPPQAAPFSLDACYACHRSVFAQ